MKIFVNDIFEYIPSRQKWKVISIKEIKCSLQLISHDENVINLHYPINILLDKQLFKLIKSINKTKLGKVIYK